TAVSVARENISLNHVDRVVTVHEGSIEELEGTFDIIAANIIASVISELMPELERRLAHDGLIIASGIIAEKEEMVISSMSLCGMEIKAKHSSGDWRCLVIGR